MIEFSFFGYLTLRLYSGHHSGYEHYFRNEYARISSSGSITADSVSINVHIVKDLPERGPSDLCRTVNVKNLFTFRYLISGIHSEEVNIYFRRHWLDRLYMNAIAVFLQAQVIEPVMYLKLLNKNVLFMHAAGVSGKSEGFLFPAHGGTGKTTFSIALLNNGFRLLGDDLLFVALDEGIVYPYPRPMHIFTYNVNNLAGARIPPLFKARIYLKNVIRFILKRVLKTEFLISTRIHADDVFSDEPFGTPVPYKKIFFLRKTGEAVDPQLITDMNRASLVEEIIDSADLNDSLYRIIDAPKEIALVRERERVVVEKMLSQICMFTYVNPRKLDLTNLNVFIKKYL